MNKEKMFVQTASKKHRTVTAKELNFEHPSQRTQKIFHLLHCGLESLKILIQKYSV